VGNSELEVIENGGEVIGGKSVFTHDHVVTRQCRKIVGLGALQAVNKIHFALIDT
jgi:hypothetical protein